MINICLADDRPVREIDKRGEVLVIGTIQVPDKKCLREGDRYILIWCRRGCCWAVISGVNSDDYVQGDVGRGIAL